MPKRGYHHGNLRQALVEAALALIEEKGPTGFTLSEAAKLAGVTPAAVYRHFGGREDLIAANLSLEEVRQQTGADSLAYLSLEGLRRAVTGGDDKYCTACFTGEYPTALSDELSTQMELFTPAGAGPAARETG